jgi:tetratricopeptide (TPR) repeat protein
MALRKLTSLRDPIARATQWTRTQLARIPHRLGRRTGEQVLVKLLARIPNRGILAAVKARILWSLNDRAGAMLIIRSALARAPHNRTLIARLARMEIEAGSYRDAEMRLRSALNDLTAAGGTGLLWQLVSLLTYALLHQGKSAEAWTLLSSGPGTRLAVYQVRFLQAHVCRHTRRYDEAEDFYTQVLAQKPNDIWALWELAELLSLRGKLAEAEALHHRISRVARDPTFNARNHSHTLLAQGRVREGWARNLVRVENSELKKLQGVRVWDGSDLAARSIFVIVEGGTGDELRDAVCYRELSERAAQVTIACDPRLETLLKRSFPRVKTWPTSRTERVSGVNRRLSRLIDEATLEEVRRHDFCVVGPDLFYFFKPAAEDYGKPSPYLQPDPKLVAHWRARLAALGPGPKIGVAWSTIRQNYRFFSCYTKLAEWGPILTAPGAVFVNLQYGDCKDELREAEQRFGVRIHRWPDLDLLNDFDSVAGLIAELDLVLAPNSTTLELAGALGARAWYMVNEYQTLDHFRLMDPATRQDRCYPSVRIFMAKQPGDSTSLIAQVAGELERTFGLSRSRDQKSVVGGESPSAPGRGGTSAARAPR